jgi:hypothetical protein
LVLRKDGHRNGSVKIEKTFHKLSIGEYSVLMGFRMDVLWVSGKNVLEFPIIGMAA